MTVGMTAVAVSMAMADQDSGRDRTPDTKPNRRFRRKPQSYLNKSNFKNVKPHFKKCFPFGPSCIWIQYCNAKERTEKAVHMANQN